MIKEELHDELAAEVPRHAADPIAIDVLVAVRPSVSAPFHTDRTSRGAYVQIAGREIKCLGKVWIIADLPGRCLADSQEKNTNDGREKSRVIIIFHH